MKQEAETTIRNLHQLACSYGIQISYQNILDGRRRQADPDVLVAMLRALGADLRSPADAPRALQDRRRAIYTRGTDPVAIAWNGRGAKVTLRIPAGQQSQPWHFLLRLESGEEKIWDINPEDSKLVSRANRVEVEGNPYWDAEVELPGTLPFGYHTLAIDAGKHRYGVTVISAPLEAFTGSGEHAEKPWGVFIPVYALPSDSNWGVGDFGDLRALMQWVEDSGGSLVGTLPLLATFLDKPFDPSPYSPVSRLFWNELFLDMNEIPEMNQCEEAQNLVASDGFQAELNDLRSMRLVDYRRAMGVKRKALEPLARMIFEHPSRRQDELLRYVNTHRDLEDYAQFRATCDRRRSSWWTWPEPSHGGTLCADDYDSDAMRYHLYVQWMAEQQIRSFAKGCRPDGEGLYLDLPLGVNSDGYDVWRERSSFVLDMSAGSPPDGFFTKGQSWGFPPLNPEKIRENGFTYFRKALQHHMAHACVLRIDHVMGLHRLFCVPKGFEPQDGAYMRYPSDEMYAILALESVRNKTVVVGEDLGTVPGYVRPALARHKIQRMYVVQFEVQPAEEEALREPSEDSVAALNTHDMPTFASFWDGLDVQDRVDLGLLDQEGAITELRNRAELRSAIMRSLCPDAGDGQGASIREALKASLGYLGRSRSRMVIANLEDLWFEKQPQNVPGTSEERPNWKRKSRFSLRQITDMTEVADMLKILNGARRGKETL